MIFLENPLQIVIISRNAFYSAKKSQEKIGKFKEEVADGENASLPAAMAYAKVEIILAKQIKIKNGKNYLIAESIGFYFNHHKYYQNNKKESIYLKIINLIFLILNLPIVAKKGQEGTMYLSIKNYLIRCLQ